MLRRDAPAAAAPQQLAKRRHLEGEELGRWMGRLTKATYYM